jgi:hypothetical protein
MNIAHINSPNNETQTPTEIIQLSSPIIIKNTTSTSSSSSVQHSLLSSNPTTTSSYVPQTLVSGNDNNDNHRRRLSILPTFMSVDNSTSQLLLANVPGKTIILWLIELKKKSNFCCLLVRGITFIRTIDVSPT